MLMDTSGLDSLWNNNKRSMMFLNAISLFMLSVYVIIWGSAKHIATNAKI
jgi:hypothetical protein